MKVHRQLTHFPIVRFYSSQLKGAWLAKLSIFPTIFIMFASVVDRAIEYFFNAQHTQELFLLIICGLSQTPKIVCYASLSAWFLSRKHVPFQNKFLLSICYLVSASLNEKQKTDSLELWKSNFLFILIEFTLLKAWLRDPSLFKA